jgi:hypothetical protein
MSFKLSLDGVEPWSAGGMILNPGNHPVTVVDEEIDETGDHPVVMLQMEAIGGEETGGEVRDWVHITNKSLGRVAQIYEAFGVEIPSGEFEWIPLKGRNAKAVVREEPRRDDPSKNRTVVKGYSNLGGDSDVAAVASAVVATPIAGATGAADDIPF